jgi:spore coat polysaccharide biosynthesis predicted glycosyltransferase SpsG
MLTMVLRVGSERSDVRYGGVPEAGGWRDASPLVDRAQANIRPVSGWAASAQGPAVGLRCDATPTGGVGHVVRSLAIADELRSRGLSAVLLGSVGVGWVRDAVDAREITVQPTFAAPDALAAQTAELGLRAVVLDGYELDRACGAAVRSQGIRVLSLLDGSFGSGQAADVYLDQNLGAPIPPVLEPGATLLRGLRYVLLRDEVLECRSAVGWPGASDREVPRVLAVFGGTDAHGACPVLVDLMLRTGLSMEVMAVAADDSRAALLHDLLPGFDQSLEVVKPVPDLARLAVTCDAVVTAAGSSVWEFLCLGVPTVVVSVADNQDLSYQAVVGAGLAAGGGRLADLRHDPAAFEAARIAVGELLGSWQRRAELADRGMRLVDGEGRRRVVDALLGPGDRR